MNYNICVVCLRHFVTTNGLNPGDKITVTEAGCDWNGPACPDITPIARA